MQSASDCLECVGPTCDLTAPLRSGAPSLYKQIVASTVGSSVAVLTLNPITVIKVHLQKAAPGVSIVSVVRGIGRDRGFWRGSSVGLMQALPNSVLYMSIYEDLKRRLATTMPPAYSSLSPGLAGGLARIVCVTAMSPLEVIRTAQTGGASSSLADLGRDIIRNRGLSGFYSGWGSTLARDAPFSAIYWFAFDLLRPVWNGGEGGVNGESFSNIATFCAGASSSMIAAVCTHPFDVLKTQHQLSVAKAGAAVGNVSLSTVVRAGGVLGLYRGLSMRLATVIPGSALMVTIYEWVKANV